MKRIKKFLSLLFAVLFAISTVSCKPENQAAPPKKEKTASTLRWVICDTDTTLNGKWSSYEVLKGVSKTLGISPELQLVKNDFSTEVATRILSDTYPDLFTLPLPDKNLLKLKSAMPHLEFSTESSVYSALPETVANAHRQENVLWYVPGGFSTVEQLVPKEGIYVLTDVQRSIPSPDVSNFQELIGFIKSCRFAGANGVSDQLLFGPSGNETLEHLFGIDTNMRYGFEGMHPSDPSVAALKAFYTSLTLADISPRQLTDFNEAARPLVFIGEQDFVVRWNQAARRTLYQPLNLVGTDDGFLAAYPKNGSYATLVFDGKRSQDAVKLVTHLLREDVSKTLMLGIENTHWLSSNAQNDPVITNYQAQEMRKGNSNLWNSVGISAFPYLSSYGAVYPKLDFPKTLPRDLFTQQQKTFVDPFSEEGLRQTAAANELLQRYRTN